MQYSNPLYYRVECFEKLATEGVGRFLGKEAFFSVLNISATSTFNVPILSTDNSPQMSYKFHPPKNMNLTK